MQLREKKRNQVLKDRRKQQINKIKDSGKLSTEDKNDDGMTLERIKGINDQIDGVVENLTKKQLGRKYMNMTQVIERLRSNGHMKEEYFNG